MVAPAQQLPAIHHTFQAIVKHLPNNSIDRVLNNPLVEQDALQWLLQLRDVKQLHFGKGGALCKGCLRRDGRAHAVTHPMHWKAQVLFLCPTQ